MERGGVYFLTFVVKNRVDMIHDLVSYYRDLRPLYFSDSKAVYDIPLTRELFDAQLALLSTKKMQSEFENFVVACACRLITPNIKSQTGPDGGGDGKVDVKKYKTHDLFLITPIQSKISFRIMEDFADTCNPKQQAVLLNALAKK